MRKKIHFVLFLALLTISTSIAFAQTPAIRSGMNDGDVKKIKTKINTTLGKYPSMFAQWKSESERKVKLTDCRIIPSRKRLELYFNEGLLQIGIREDLVLQWEQMVRDTLTHYTKENFDSVQVALYSQGLPIERYIPNAYRSRFNKDSKRLAKPSTTTPLTRHSYRPVFGKGLDMRHIALWPSHGYYYETRDSEPSWKYQRPALFAAIEDLNMFDYAYNYLIPMLENAGAIVISPRERSVQRAEIIADNDLSHKGSSVKQISGNWRKEQGGFLRIDKITDENPQTKGTYLVADGDAEIDFRLQLPDKGKYGVTISYKALPTNKSKVTYTIYHKGGVSEVEVNQRIMGSTWVYLGEWEFDNEARVTLSGSGTGTITADAVRFGGGMGSVERGGSVSGVPRWAEGARYYMQYSGVPESVYKVGEIEAAKNPKRNAPKEQDYVDDYKSRGDWVNWLRTTQKAPVDLAIGIHSNSGSNDTIFGTLTIHYTEKQKGTLDNGNSKFASRDFADMVLTQIVDDIRALHTPGWTRRSLYDKTYAEISRPNIPSILVEMFSHQDSIDMSYATNPTFKFDMSRAIYKGILKFLATYHSRSYEVQPLPVNNFKMELKNSSTLSLMWRATNDPLEPTAKPSYYKVYTQVGEDSDFDNGVEVRFNHIELPIIKDGVMRKYRVTALNEGGESFVSPTLSCGFSTNFSDIDDVVVIFNKNQSPFTTVDYIHNYGYVGEVYDLDPLSEFIDNDNPGFGASRRDKATIGLRGAALDNTTAKGAEILKNDGSYISN